VIDVKMATLTLKNDNLYQTGQIEQYSDGTEMLIREKIAYVKTGKEKIYTIRKGDTLRKIAFDKYKNIISEPQNWWWVIADINEIENPLFLSELIGTKIIIPDLYQAKLSM
jgi:hypothetical protein